MRSTHGTRGDRRIWKTGLTLLAALAMAFTALPALAQDGPRMSGESFLEAKNSEERTLQLEELLVRVTDDTRIYDHDEKRISFEMIPDPTETMTVVEYSGSPSGKNQMIARRLVVRIPPQ